MDVQQIRFECIRQAMLAEHRRPIEEIIREAAVLEEYVLRGATKALVKEGKRKR